MRHLKGHSEPILKPLVDEIMQDKMDDIGMKIAAMNSWINVKTQRDAEVEQYLQEVHRRRPEEAPIVETAFTQVAHELLELRAAAGGAARPTGLGASTSASTGTTASSSQSSSQNIMAEHLAMKEQLGGVQATLVQLSAALQGKCH